MREQEERRIQEEVERLREAEVRREERSGEESSEGEEDKIRRLVREELKKRQGGKKIQKGNVFCKESNMFNN